MSADDDRFIYKSGIPTLRSSCHRVRSNKKLGKIPKPKSTSKDTKIETLLPLAIRKVEKFSYNTLKYNLHQSLVNLLQDCNDALVGSFDENITELESFRVPVSALIRNANGGNLNEAQEYLSDRVSSSEEFLSSFDCLVEEEIIPHLKSRLAEEGIIQSMDENITCYYQRPPTLRIQPGPARAVVNAHRDSVYGHQPGELNYWIPLTNRNLTGVDLWCESDADLGDYEPLGTDKGEVTSFHGSSCRHYVPNNLSTHSRVSLDFRIGIEPFYDPHWEMIGTRNDHLRRKIVL